MDPEINLQFWAIMTQVAMNILVDIFVDPCFQFPWVSIQGRDCRYFRVEHVSAFGMFFSLFVYLSASTSVYFYS